MSNRTTCKAHCVACGRHFGGEAAFDMHRTGDHANGSRHCTSPLDDPKQRLTGSPDGWCEISGEHDHGHPSALHPVTVWQREYNAASQQSAEASHETVSHK